MFQNLDGAIGILLADDDEVILQIVGRLGWLRRSCGE